ncbi:MAG: YjjW family glycine radical enzyme activase [Firmicutes bacterium]|nr:YjjW family glycine radical enzyme activase [Bacillota bacterium]
MKAVVNKIIHTSVVDGPGNRAAIFLQGCNYTCGYCHNPETINLCGHCGACVSVCPAGALSMEDGKVVWNEEVCCQCDECLSACRNMSTPKTKEYSAQEIMDILKKDIPFIRGITVSGGECSLQRDFLVELFRLVKAKRQTTLMDSNGSYDYTADEELMAVCDGVMLDVKAWNEAEHMKLTGMSSTPVIENALKLAKAGKLEEIRTVVVPGYLNNRETVDRITKLLAPLQEEKPIRYRISAYRPFGVREPYRSEMRSPSREELEELAEIARKNGITDIVII